MDRGGSINLNKILVRKRTEYLVHSSKKFKGSSRTYTFDLDILEPPANSPSGERVIAESIVEIEDSADKEGNKKVCHQHDISVMCVAPAEYIHVETEIDIVNESDEEGQSETPSEAEDPEEEHTSRQSPEQERVISPCVANLMVNQKDCIARRQNRVLRIGE